MIKANIDGNEVELKPDDLQLGEGYALVTPDSIPKGYYNESALERAKKEAIGNVSERITQAKKNAEEELLNNDAFNKRVLQKYNIALDKDGKPAGLEPTVDIDEIRIQERKEVAEQKDSIISELQSELEKRNQAVIENSILSASNAKFQDHWVESIDGEKPLIVEKFTSKFGVDENGEPYLKNESGEKAFKNDGSLIRPNDYFSNEDVFGKYYKDQRQKGSGFEGAGNPGASSPSDILSWKAKQKSEYISKHGAEKYRKAVEQAVQSKK